MNEQIQHLATRAGLYVDSNGRPYPQALSAEQANAALQKFAELIVRECMDIAREVGTSTEPEDFALDRCYEIETKIKEHFGVEE